MQPRIRKWLGFLLFLAITTAVIGTRSRTLETVILAVVWILLLVGSLIAWLRTPPHRCPDGTTTRSLSQLSVLPPRWQRWVLGESGAPATRPPTAPPVPR